MKRPEKKRMRRLTPLLLVLVLLLTGCGPAGGKHAAGSAEDLVLAENGETRFRIVYASGCPQETLDSAGYLQREIARLTGAALELCEDMAVGASEESWEILLGATDRSEDDLTFDELQRTGEYLVCVQGRKLTVGAALNDCLSEAVQELCDVLGEYFGGGRLCLPAEFTLSGGIFDTPAAELPPVRGGSFLGACDAGNGSELLIYRADSRVCDSYLETLEAAGYTRYSENEIDGNRYFTYLGSDQTLTVMDNPALDTVRISVDPREYRLDREAAQYSAAVTPSVTMLGLEGYDTSGTPNQNGLSLLYQLCDGSFIVVDGGHNVDLAADQLYETMAALAPDPNDITIAAWIITHSHNDHAGAFMNFRRNHALEVKLEKLLVNFPSDKQYSASSTSTYYRENVLSDVMYYPGAEVIKVHPGQVFYLRDAVVEILYTLDLYEPAGLADFNDSSVVCTVSLGGQKLLQTGDCGIMTSDILVILYPQALQCDILQVSHHGYQGGTEELYRAVDPLYVLWPSGSSTYNTGKNGSNNTWLLNESHMRQLWVARDDIYTLRLPISD